MNWTAEDYLEHHGIKGQKWGIRRYQNPDGTLTDAGRKRYGTVRNLNRGVTLKQIRKQKAKHTSEIEKRRKARQAEYLAKVKRDNEKQEAIAKGDAVGVYKFRTELSTKDLQDAVQRIDLTKKLAAMQPPPKESLGKKVAKAIGRAALDATASAAKNTGALLGRAAFDAVTAPVVLPAKAIINSRKKAAKEAAEEAAAKRKGKLIALQKVATEQESKLLREKFEAKEKKAANKQSKREERKEKKKTHQQEKNEHKNNNMSRKEFNSFLETIGDNKVKNKPSDEKRKKEWEEYLASMIKSGHTWTVLK